MSRSILYMSMSLDGFITGPDDDAEHGLGVGPERVDLELVRTLEAPGMTHLRYRATA